jgi:hypothetical protein
MKYIDFAIIFRNVHQMGEKARNSRYICKVLWFYTLMVIKDCSYRVLRKYVNPTCHNYPNYLLFKVHVFVQEAVG